MSTNFSYSFKVWFKSTGEPMTFTVAEAAWGRLKKALQEKRRGFFIWATLDGRTLALNLTYVQMARFTFKESPANEQVPGERHSKITLHFTDSRLESFEVADAADLANVFSTLKSDPSEKGLSFTTIDDESIVFLTEALILIDTSTVFVEEGYLKILNEKKAARQKA
ncbi:MAG: hypothetical protein GX971_00775 [Firmicutes bacterium]|nr:hypothetical protein [Bacillota bacterium]